MSEPAKLKTALQLTRELRRVQKLLQAKLPLNEPYRSEQYGAQQALEWALGNNACAPSKLANTPKAKP